MIGAGPAGLSVAESLKRRGYRNVTVMEKLGRIGGLCFTVTEDYTCFDLGANYLTPDYRETLRLARRHGVARYAEKNFVVAEIDADRPGYRRRSPWSSARGSTPVWTFVTACFRYAWKRWRLSAAVDPPGLADIHRHPELCRPFLEWLDRNGIACLATLFEMPVTVMGYGYLAETPAAYVLKYMGVRTFLAMCVKAFPLTRWFWWPKRFVLGYQWLWECVARELNVWCNVEVLSIDRSGERLRIQYLHREQLLNDSRGEEDSFEFDHLILACPLSLDVLERFLAPSDEERRLFTRIETVPYCMTSLKVGLPDLPAEFAMATLPLTRIGTPWAITKQEASSDFTQFYSRLEAGDLCDPKRTQERIHAEVLALIERLGGKPGSVCDDAWHSFDVWPYFKHVSPETMAAGFYAELEALQGVQGTYYAGGLMDFDLVERIVRYSQDLVDRHFPPVAD